MNATNSPPVFPYEPTQDERTFAILAHALQMVGWWIAPLVILITKRESKFVSFHTLQALLLQVAYLLGMVLVMMIWFATMFATMFKQMPTTGQPAGTNVGPPPLMFVVFPLIWLGWMAGWAVALVASILYSVKAGQGEWAKYPLLGRLARRILHLPTT